ncbi:outer membrane protein assembly factor BamE [Ramlibacter rhizophilus]|uniref:Outer membrane protein assembly factor BamE n=1 Tax=Ramlibacter rhizophilus TaxID=1781167 RepID=A0A4Z0BIK5_9BURK|nr:outer membrane protein assembly factor BamE [Ramlibacter rhizophilus]TFY98087.1 outer membrane protein assembly factor BamE [Ramlibacter rhizophilus]
MPALHPRLSRLVLVLAASAAVAGCGSLNDATKRFASNLAPYKPPVVQGNFVSREQAELLKPGMSRQQVREVLGTPLVTSLFHADRWDYVFTLKRPGVPSQAHHLTVFFKDNALERFEGERLPSEAEFVEQIDTRRASGPVPVLQATEAQLQRFGKPAPRAEEAPAPPPASASYPPLEPQVR